MTLTTHGPARSVSSLVADDPVELAADLPRLPRGITLDLEVLRDAACGEHDVELFYPEPDDTAAEHAAKQVCATCPVREPCLDMALATGDQHAILGGTTPAERIPLRRQRQVAHARRQAAQRATAATGIDPAELIGAHVTDLHKALAHWGLEIPKLRQPAERLGVDRATLCLAWRRWGGAVTVSR